MSERNDFRNKGIEELTFYVFDNLRVHEMPNGPSIFYYDSLEEAINKFREFPDNWTTAIGCSFGGVHEIDLVHRVNNEPVKVMDFYSIDAFCKREDVHEAMKKLEKELSIRYQKVFGIHPKRSVLATLEAPEYIDSYFDNKVLHISPDRRSNSLFASLNEVYVEGSGWLDSAEFMETYQDDAYHNPHTPVVRRVNANYMEIGTGYIGQADMSPVEYKNMMTKTKEYNLSFENKKEPLDSKLANISDSQKNKVKTHESDLEKER